MKIKVSAFIFMFICTAYCTPAADPNDFDDDENMQNDNDNYGANYEDTDDTLEESKMPEAPLEITTRGEQFIRDLGETVILPCVITGSSSYVQVWRTKAAIILFQAGIRMAATSNMELLSNGSLAISNLHTQDAGEYECIAMDTKQNSPNIQHEVILRAPPQIDVLFAKDNVTLLRNGDTLILTCKASGYPKPTISWHKGSSRFDISGEILEIPKVKHHNAGAYKCLADNKIGEPAFASIDIRVEFKPVITIEKLIVSSENNSETELECIVHSEPRAQVTWLKDGSEVVSSERIRLVTAEHKHNLILKDIRDSDFGVYACLATNSLGATRKNISLVPTPAIFHFTNSQTDAKVVLTWQVQSKSNLSGRELLYRKEEDSSWKSYEGEGTVEDNLVGNDIHEVKYVFTKGLEPGEYHLRFRCQNYKGWSDDHQNLRIQALPKHGHHKPNKKGHKHGKERQVTPTPTLPSQPDVAEEPQEKEYQSGFIKESSSATDATDASSTTAPTVLLISIALLTFLRI